MMGEKNGKWWLNSKTVLYNLVVSPGIWAVLLVILNSQELQDILSLLPQESQVWAVAIVALIVKALDSVVNIVLRGVTNTGIRFKK